MPAAITSFTATPNPVASGNTVTLTWTTTGCTKVFFGNPGPPVQPPVGGPSVPPVVVGAQSGAAPAVTDGPVTGSFNPNDSITTAALTTTTTYTIVAVDDEPLPHGLTEYGNAVASVTVVVH